MAKIYISSTYKDLIEYREAAYHALRRLREDAIAMEDYVASDQRPVDLCLRDVAEADAYVGIFAWRYGWIPPKDNPERLSITEMEYRQAERLGKPRFIFLLDEEAPWPPYLADYKTGEGEQGLRIGALRDELSHGPAPARFKTKEELAALVSASISNWREWRREQEQQQREEDRRRRLREQIEDQSVFVRDRVEHFVGREQELARLWGEIEERREGGGYVVVTGDVGQGKSSLIAKLIDEQGVESSTYHFIQYHSSDDYRTSLVRKLMASLLLKYDDLPERYLERDSYQALRDYFFRALQDIAEAGRKEVIFIDGLDQLVTHAAPLPDLSFLPPKPPPGIVFVVGTRPNDTLSELKRVIGMKSDKEPCKVGNLSFVDFRLLLRHHDVSMLTESMAGRFYTAMQGNTLYLGLLARELRGRDEQALEELIERISNNPDGIFDIAFERMRGLRAWDEIIRPMLAILAMAREALTLQQMGQIRGVESYRLRDEGLPPLGGLLAPMGQEKYTLFHRKLDEYLKQDPERRQTEFLFDMEEQQYWHRRLAEWCGQGTMEQLWAEDADLLPRDDYREYGRKHYIAHLHEARAYEREFAVLDDGAYERGKLRTDPSTRTTVLDLDLGREDAARPVRRVDAGLNRLAHLWRYTLLRCSLATRADTYPDEAFQALLALGRDSGALDLAELLTQPLRRLRALSRVTQYLLLQSEREAEGLQLAARTEEVANEITDEHERAQGLSLLAGALAEAGRLELAEMLARTILPGAEHVGALSHLAVKWQQAHSEGRDSGGTASACPPVGSPQSPEAQEKARAIWQEASAEASAITNSDERDRALGELAKAFMRVGEWTRAEAMIRAIGSKEKGSQGWRQLALMLRGAGLIEQAEAAWQEIRTLLNAAEGKSEPDRVKREYALALAQAGQWEQADGSAKDIHSKTERDDTRVEIAALQVRAREWERGWEQIEEVVQECTYGGYVLPRLNNTLVALAGDLARTERWEQAQTVAEALADRAARSGALMEIAGEMARHGRSEQAEAEWQRARALCTTELDTVEAGVAGLIVAALVEAGQSEQARAIADRVGDEQGSEQVRAELAQALARVGKISGAEELSGEIITQQHKIAVQSSIAVALQKAGESERARKLAENINDKKLRWQALAMLVGECSQRKQWQEAQGIARLIEDPEVRAKALEPVIVGLAREKKVKEAEAIISSIGNRFFQDDAFCTLIIALAQAGQQEVEKRLLRKIGNERKRQKVESSLLLVAGGFLTLALPEAEQVAARIADSDERREALCHVALAYAQEREWDEAQRLIAMINERKQQDRARALVARELATCSEWDRALTTFAAIDTKRRNERLAVVREWGKRLAEPGRSEQRDKVVESVKDGRERAALLVSVAEELAQRRQEGELIRLIQQAWRQASTKDDCARLFPMVRELLVRNPDLVRAYYEAFRWVEGFLKVEAGFSFENAA